MSISRSLFAALVAASLGLTALTPALHGQGGSGAGGGGGASGGSSGASSISSGGTTGGTGASIPNGGGVSINPSTGAAQGNGFNGGVYGPAAGPGRAASNDGGFGATNLYDRGGGFNAGAYGPASGPGRAGSNSGGVGAAYPDGTPQDPYGAAATRRISAGRVGRTNRIPPGTEIVPQEGSIGGGPRAGESLVESTARRRAETAAQARQSAREREQDLRRGVARTSDNVITRSELPGAAQGSTLPGGLGSQPRTGIGSSRENQARTVERTFGPRTELPPGAPTMRTGAAEHATSGHSGA